MPHLSLVKDRLNIRSSFPNIYTIPTTNTQAPHMTQREFMQADRFPAFRVPQIPAFSCSSMLGHVAPFPSWGLDAARSLQCAVRDVAVRGIEVQDSLAGENESFARLCLRETCLCKITRPECSHCCQADSPDRDVTLPASGCRVGCVPRWAVALSCRGSWFSSNSMRPGPPVKRNERINGSDDVFSISARRVEDLSPVIRFIGAGMMLLASRFVAGECVSVGSQAQLAMGMCGKRGQVHESPIITNRGLTLPANLVLCIPGSGYEIKSKWQLTAQALDNPNQCPCICPGLILAMSCS